MKQIKLIILIVIFICGNGFLYYFSTINDITFTELQQNPEVTMKKYEDVWNDELIKKQKVKKKEYKEGDIVATLTIPSMDIYELPIYYGVDDENKNWQITTPGEKGNWQLFGEYGVSEIGAHNSQLFQNLPDLNEGDKFIVETSVDTYVYEIKEKDIYQEGQDKTWEDVAYNGKQPYSVNLVTCYPLQAEITQDRYVVYAIMKRGTILLDE